MPDIIHHSVGPKSNSGINQELTWLTIHSSFFVKMPKKRTGFWSLLLLSLICVTMLLTYFPNRLRDTSTEYWSQMDPSFRIDLDKFRIEDESSRLDTNETTRPQIDVANNQSITTATYSVNNINQTSDLNVFVIIPFRDREEHKNVFVKEMNAYLKKKYLNYKMIFVEQHGKDPFNRGKLMNVGVTEAIRGLLGYLLPRGNGKMETSLIPRELMDAATEKNLPICFIFHDIDMIPENDDIPYNCTDTPILLASSVQQYNYKLAYETYFGGVTAMKLEEIIKINGYPNRYWGWGGEDDDVSSRLSVRKMHPKILSTRIGIYKSQSHKRHQTSEEFGGRFDEVNEGTTKMDEDGIQQVNYKVLQSKVTPEYTHIIVDLLRFQKDVLVTLV